MTKTCCAPARDLSQRARPDQRIDPSGTIDVAVISVEIPGGTALIGTDTPGIQDDGESPLRRKDIGAFRMARTVVTNAQFREFIEATGYVTEAETFGWSFVFWAQVPETIKHTHAVPDVPWWRRVDGATWRAITGPGGAIAEDFPDHPVVHVSWRDAQAYAKWAGGRLPTEVEWEHAARGGQGDVPYPWGAEEPDEQTHHPCNIWQGRFPNENTGSDGYITTAPVEAYEPNAFGLYNMVGNVWEMTSDAYRIKSLKKQVKERLKSMQGFKVFKGGSFLCHRSYCYRYRIAARSGNAPDSATTHQGFRMVWDIEPTQQQPT